MLKIILSVLLLTDWNNLTQLLKESGAPAGPFWLGIGPLTTNLVSAVNQFDFDGVDIDYPFKLPCSPLLGGFNSTYSDLLNGLSLQLGNKTLMIMAGQYPINITNLNNISVDFINIQAFNLNVNSTITILSSSCPTNLISSSSSWKYGFVRNMKQSYLYQQQNSSSTNYFVIFYEDYQSLNTKIDYINNNNLAGIAIADITKNSNDSQLMNFITLGVQPALAPGEPNTTSPSTPTSEQPNTGAIVGGILGSLIFVSAIAGVGFMLYQKRKVKMSDLLKDTKNQTCSDINRQDYSDINRQVRSDTHNRIYSDTNHQSS
ncbi:hypothetical protein F8M41_011424 [Gigaspora margarita]|uniref:Chitinase n=1 Tax=Gigaspora margarita TaxID=4874 RepID=A0A8H4EQ42_GIGMA|nr:hypothetical protein F8M41_011424 [Gigaspora margarita]